MAKTAPALTERQQEIRKLQTEGLTPPQIAERLKISPNAVYQQLSRMRGRKGGGQTTKAKGKAAPKGRQSAPALAAAPKAPVSEQRAMTPLQAIRHRLGEIESQIKESVRRVDQARKAAEAERESHERLLTNRDAELAQLRAAEAALTGKPVEKPKAKRSKSSNGRARTPESAPASEPTPEPQPQAAQPSPNGGESQEQTVVPSSQAERESSQSEFDKDAAAAPADQGETQAETAQAPASA